jgi:bisanhydrobacterioruberin hydratase
MLKSVQKYSLYFLILVYVSGAIGFVFNPSFFIPFTPYNLVFTSFVFLIHQPIQKSAYFSRFVGLIVVGFVAEVVGVKTGLVFGEYSYGTSLGYALLGVPLTISLNWALLINSGILITRSISSHNLSNALLSASIITGVDLLIEQTAAQMDFWYFKGGGAGIHNYIAWFVISFFASLFFQKQVGTGDKRIALIILGLQVFFFGLIFISKILNTY